MAALPASSVASGPANGQTANPPQKVDAGKDARGFARALLDLEKPKKDPNDLLSRQVCWPAQSYWPFLTSSLQTGWGRDARGTLRATPSSKRAQLQAMKADRFWFSTINFAKARDEGVKKATVDSLENQLSLKWDDFIASLPKLQRPGAKKVRDGYDAAGVAQLENQVTFIRI